MSFSDKLKLFLILLFAFNFAEAKSESDWTYKKFPLVKPGQKVSLPPQINLNGESLKPLLSPRSGTHLKIGVDQIYISKNSKRKVFVKQDVAVSNQKILNQWINIGGGSVYHFKKDSKLMALFAVGYNERALNQIEKQFNSTRFRKVSALDLFVNCAYAQEIGFGDPMGVNPYYIEETYQTGSKGDPNADPDLVGCILAKTGEGVWNAGASAVTAVSDGAGAVKDGAVYAWNDPMGAASATGSYLYDVGEGAVVGAWNGAKAVGGAVADGAVATYNYAGEVISDPSKVWTDVTSAYDKTVLAAETVYKEVEASVVGFSELPPAVRTLLVCEVTAMAITEIGVSGILALTGAGATGAVVKTANFFRKIKNLTTTMLPVLRELGTSTLSVGDKKEIIQSLLKDRMTSEQALARIRGTGAPPPNRALAAASPDMTDVPAVSPSPALATAKEITAADIDRIEGRFENRNIQVKSVSGNTYEGEFVEFVRTDGELMAVLRNPDGTTSKLRASRLKMETMVEKNNTGFTVNAGGQLDGVAGTSLGDKVVRFKTVTNLDIEFGKDPNMKRDFHIDGTGKLVLHPSLAKDPAKLEALLTTSIKQAAISDRRARTTLNTQGMYVTADGTIKTMGTPTTTLGKMIKGLDEKHGIRVTYHESSLDEVGAAGLSFTGEKRITISRDYLQAGRETELLALVRHEVKHSTSDRGAAKYPVASIWEDGATGRAGLHYSGEQIRFTPSSKGVAPDSLMERSGIHSIYSSGMRADEYSARLTQYPSASSRATATERATPYSQGFWIQEITTKSLKPTNYFPDSNKSGVSYVRYQVPSESGDVMVVDVPIRGEVRSREHAESIAGQIVADRLRYIKASMRPKSTRSSP